MRAHRMSVALAVFALATATMLQPAASVPLDGDRGDGMFEQSISMPFLPDTTVDQVVAVDATATSLLPVRITVTGACEVRQLLGGVVIVAKGPGQCRVQANQDGDDLWLPAPVVYRTFDFFGGDAGVAISIDGPSWLMAAQGLSLRIPVRVSADDVAGARPTGTVTATLTPGPKTPACTSCLPTQATLDDSGRATIEINGAFTEKMAVGTYNLAIEYSGDVRYAKGTLRTGNVSIVPPGQQLGGEYGALPIVVSLGDSYISGEAGRWAGNTLDVFGAWRADVGEHAYHDAGTTEAIAGCHRSKNSEIHIEQAGAPVVSVNLACSGAETTTSYNKSGDFKPGIDFMQDESRAHRGQPLELYRLASANPGRVKMVVLSIGGNDFQFGTVVQTCLLNFLDPWGKPCKDLDSVKTLFAEPNWQRQLAAITGAIHHVDEAMTQAGYTSSDWDLVVQDYPSPVPGEIDRVRYPEKYSRQTVGGCGMFDADLTYANDVMLKRINQAVHDAVEASGLPNAHFLDLSNAYYGNRLCEKGPDLVGPGKTQVHKWTDPGAAIGSEWVSPIRAAGSFVPFSPFQLQESLHPGYWGQLANQVCVKLAYNHGDVRGGACVRVGGIYPNLDGDDRVYPVMELVRLADTPSTDARPSD